ncbi:MAG: trypsin-like peptidase domain-containing protein [Planctomycetes bacterium]|nr:trypsin-like peptidase domain-containing protein [Planctomycetota bacterium]
MRRANWLIGVLACVPVFPLQAEIISLSDGRKVVGEILREYPDRIAVDLGFEILTIPRTQIASIAKEETPISADNKIRNTKDLYSTADLPPKSIKALTEEFGEGVGLVSSPSGLGSGFFISEDGHLITNFHVVEGETKLAVTVFRKRGNEFAREKIEDVEIVATNPFLDLALLKVAVKEGVKPRITYLAEEDALRDGDTVFAIGNPLGLERSVSEGIVSRCNRAEEGLVYIQTTTQINPGNSGGPLFNNRGEVVGVTNMKIMGGEGLGFAIPIRYVIDFLKNRDAFAYNSESSVAGYRYLQPPARQVKDAPKFLKRD